VKHNSAPILFAVGIAAAAALLAAGGPILWAIAVMGIPFIAGFVLLGGIAHGHVDNGHFRHPDEKR
jgi:hypothetical protein